MSDRRFDGGLKSPRDGRVVRVSLHSEEYYVECMKHGCGYKTDPKATRNIAIQTHAAHVAEAHA